MQEQYRSFSQFSLRSDLLSEHYRVPVAEIAGKMDISERMLFGYRTGKYPISAKAWRKLEAAERSAGIYVEPHPSTVAIAKFVEINDRRHAGEELSEAEKAESDRLAPQVVATLEKLSAQIAGMQSAIERIEKTLLKK